MIIILYQVNYNIEKLSGETSCERKNKNKIISSIFSFVVWLNEIGE